MTLSNCVPTICSRNRLGKLSCLAGGTLAAPFLAGAFISWDKHSNLFWKWAPYPVVLDWMFLLSGCFALLPSMIQSQGTNPTADKGPRRALDINALASEVVLWGNQCPLPEPGNPKELLSQWNQTAHDSILVIAPKSQYLITQSLIIWMCMCMDRMCVFSACE